MKQRDIKLPITCDGIIQVIFLGFVFGFIGIAFAVEQPFLSIVPVTFSFIMWWLWRWMDDKLTFPFKFSCKCDDESKANGD